MYLATPISVQTRTSIEGALIVSEFISLENVLLFFEENSDILD
jgi:hypothetical protein